MVERDQQVATYVTASQHQTISAKAQSQGLSISEWLRDAANEKIEREGMESSSDRYRVEERLLDLVDDAADRAAEQIIEEIREELAEEDHSSDLADWGT